MTHRHFVIRPSGSETQEKSTIFNAYYAANEVHSNRFIYAQNMTNHTSFQKKTGVGGRKQNENKTIAHFCVFRCFCCSMYMQTLLIIMHLMITFSPVQQSVVVVVVRAVIIVVFSYSFRSYFSLNSIIRPQIYPLQWHAYKASQYCRCRCYCCCCDGCCSLLLLFFLSFFITLSLMPVRYNYHGFVYRFLFLVVGIRIHYLFACFCFCFFALLVRLSFFVLRSAHKPNSILINSKCN